MGIFWKEAIFFIDETKNVVLACLRLETRSKIQYSWSFTTHSISSANFFLLPCCTFTPFYSKRASYFFHLKGSSMKDILERSIFFHRWDQKRCFNLSTLRNTFQDSLLLKFHQALKIFIKFLLLFGCTSTPFYTKRARYSLHLSHSSMEEFLKRSNFFTVETKIGFILSTLRNRFQHLLLLKFLHALKNFIKLRFAALVHFYPILI